MRLKPMNYVEYTGNMMVKEPENSGKRWTKRPNDSVSW